ncbi:MAG: protease modulator HflC [Dongiaceae bacterium]
MNRFGGAAILVVAIAGIVLLLQAVFTVHQSERALVLQLGKPIRVVDDPGLNFKIPFIQNVEPISKRVLRAEASQEELLTQDQKRVVVDYFARYKIIDPLLFYQSVRTTEMLEQRLKPIIQSQLRRVLGGVQLARILTKERADMMREITVAVDTEIKRFGITVLDVRMKRVDLPKENSEAIFNRMRSQRQQEAALIRAEGDRIARALRAEGAKKHVVIRADARRQAEILRGEGDAKATETYNQAYGQDPEFFNFYRSMQALSLGLGGDTTTYVGPPSGDFFRFFGLQDDAMTRPGNTPNSGQ